MSSRNLGRRTYITVKFNNTDISEDINRDIDTFSYTDEADGATDDLKIKLNDPNNIWIGSWLRKELEGRDQGNAQISSGNYGTSEETETGGTSYMVTAKIGLNVRTGPGTGNTKVGALSYGAETTVYSIDNGWAKIRYNGGTYYACAQYLTPSKSGGTTSSSTTQDGSSTNGAKYTRIEAAITLCNYDGLGHDKVLNCGSFELDDVTVSGPPQVVELGATSLSYQSAIRKTKKTRSWNNTTLKEISGTIAEAGGYTLMYLSAYVPNFTYMLQDNQSDIEFLSERAKNAGLCLKVTDGILVMFDAADYEQKDAVRTIKRGDGSYTSYNFETSLSTTAYSSCHVSYEDEDGNTYEATFTPNTAFSEGEVLEVTEEVTSNEEAMELAKKRLRAENKGEMTGNLTMVGDTDLCAGNNVEIEGWGDFDGKWSIDRAEHSISGKYVTKIEISKVIEGY
jgi:phage protein D